MERKHMSAFALYQTVSADLPPPSKKSFVQAPGKKKKKENSAKEVTALKSQLKPAKKKAQKKTQKHSLNNGTEEVNQTENGDSEDLTVMLADLATVDNSRERASKLFQWLISPIPAETFFRETWEKKPILVQRKNPDYYKGLFSTAEFDRILRGEDVQYGVNLDVTSYTNGTRETHNPPGRALPYTVWGFYKSGCSLRLLNPQAFSATVWNVLSILQENFGSMAGANIYLTPPGTQGFAPHYDDIEAFVVQLEGKKHWRVYKPRVDDEILPVLSSPNFDEVEIGEPILEVVLEAGDLLYFPRGFIHQGDCLPDAHSLHITISSYQKNSWGDLLQRMLPAALEIAMEEDVEFRRGLPLDYLTYMGVQNSDLDDPRRPKFLSQIETLMKKLASYCPVDAAVDQKARDFLHDCLPPMLTTAEQASSVKGARTRWECDQVMDDSSDISTRTRIRLLRAGCARLCSDGEAVHLYYTTDNSRVYHQEELKSFEVNTEVDWRSCGNRYNGGFFCSSVLISGFFQLTDAVEFLIHSYPKFVTVGSLPCTSTAQRIALAEQLFEKGIIHTSEPL